MASAVAKKKSRQRTHRYTSNVFSMFSQAQIQEFKEAFNMIDQNRDGFVDKDDLIEMLTSLGKNPTDDYVDGMIQEAPGPINFTMFLTLFGDKMNGTDPEDVITNAFACFDEQHSGALTEERFREVMTTMGDRWTDDMVDELLQNTGCVVAPQAASKSLGSKSASSDSAAGSATGSLFNYMDFIRTLKHGATQDDIDETRTGNTAAVSTKA